MVAKATPGVVRADESYLAEEFRHRVGLADFSWRAARKAGLKVVRFGRKIYVRGADWHEFLERVSAGEIVDQEEQP